MPPRGRVQSRLKWLILRPDEMLSLFCHGNTITLTTEMGVPPDANVVHVSIIEPYDIKSEAPPKEFNRLSFNSYQMEQSLLWLKSAEIAIRYTTEELDWPDVVVPRLEPT